MTGHPIDHDGGDTWPAETGDIIACTVLAVIAGLVLVAVVSAPARSAGVTLAGAMAGIAVHAARWLR